MLLHLICTTTPCDCNIIICLCKFMVQKVMLLAYLLHLINDGAKIWIRHFGSRAAALTIRYTTYNFKIIRDKGTERMPHLLVSLPMQQFSLKSLLSGYYSKYKVFHKNKN